MLETLRQTTVLPGAAGAHNCECGHPEMRRLPDGTRHRPACHSEVLPHDALPISWKAECRSKAYWSGWLEGRFSEIGSFADNPNLARWEAPSDRLAYYQCHRADIEARWAAENDRLPKAHRSFPGGWGER
jgi:hypothetical protein